MSLVHAVRQEDGSIRMAADHLATDGSFNSYNLREPKWFTKRLTPVSSTQSFYVDATVATTGTRTVMQIMKHMDWPALSQNTDLEKWLHRVLGTLREHLSEWGLIEHDEEGTPRADVDALIVVRDRMFVLSGHFDYNEPKEDFIVLGMGAFLWQGAYEALREAGSSAADAQDKAHEIACRSNVSYSKEVDVLILSGLDHRNALEE